MSRLSSKNDKTSVHHPKKQEEEFVRLLPKESDFNLNERDHHSLISSERIKDFLKEFNTLETDKNKIQFADNNTIENIPGFSYSDEPSIYKVRKESGEKIRNKIKQVECEIMDEDNLIEQQKISNITNEMEYLQSISDKFVTAENLETAILHVLDNPTCYCFALDVNGNKHRGYTQIDGQEMKSLWDGNPHPSSFESYVDTRKSS